MAVFLSLCIFSAVATFASRKIEFSNYCDETVWVGLSASWNDNFPTWWNDDASILFGETQTLTFPTDDVTSISFWGRTRCDFSAHQDQSPYTCCATGDCECRKICQNEEHSAGGTMKYAGTLGEINFASTDNYDLSNIEGFNLPMTIKPLEPFKNNSGWLGCRTAGKAFEDIKNWKEAFLGGCESYSEGENLVYKVAEYDESTNQYICDLEGTEPYPSERFCLISNTTEVSYEAYQSFCISDKAISGKPDISGVSRPASWPLYWECDGGSLVTGPYGCPACGSLTGEGNTCCSDGPCGCPSNYHCPDSTNGGTPDEWCSSKFKCSAPYSGLSPFTDWPKMMYDAGLTWGSYLFVYDDDIMGLACDTLSGSTGYSVVFCPANSEEIAGSENPDMDGIKGYFVLMSLFLPCIALTLFM